MITRVLIFIKRRLPWAWVPVDRANGFCFRFLYSKRMLKQVERAFSEFGLDGFTFAPLKEDNLPDVRALIERQTPDRLEHFQPHAFDESTLRCLHKNPAFLMFGVFSGANLVGYFFLRCFSNRRCFVGRLIDEPFEKQGIGRVMNQILYHSCWWSGFRCMTTVSKSNAAVIRSHERNPYARVRHALSDDYMLIEFCPDSERRGNTPH